MLYTKELVQMRSQPRQSSIISINIAHSGKYSQNCRGNTCAHCALVRKFGGELLLQLLQLGDFGFGLDSLLVMVWTL
jgi:hypothetical protein